MSFLKFFASKTYTAKEIPLLTNMLAQNPLFRRMVLGFHNTKASAMDDLDKYLESQLLDKDDLAAKKNRKRLDNITTGGRGKNNNRQ